MGPQSCEGQAWVLGCLKDVYMGREQRSWPAGGHRSPCPPKSKVECRMPAPEPSCPTRGRHRSNVGFPAPAFSSSPFGPPDQRDTWLEREAGTYLRLRRARLAQRAPISAATPVSLMELLCRLKTEERAQLAWLSQDSEGAISPAETLSSTGSWGTPEAGATSHCFFSSSLFPL